MVSRQEIKDKLVGLGVLATIGVGGYYGCFAPRTLENSVVTEIGTYRAYIDPEDASQDETHTYIEVDNHYRCLDLGEYHNLSFVKGDKIAGLEYIPKLQCSQVVKLVREK